MARSWVFEWFGVRPLDLIQSRIKFTSLWRVAMAIPGVMEWVLKM